jgi:hypothetical protein
MMAINHNFTLYTKHTVQGVHEHSAYVQLQNTVEIYTDYLFVCQLPQKQLQYLINISLRLISFCTRHKANNPPHTQGAPDTSFYTMQI